MKTLLLMIMVTTASAKEESFQLDPSRAAVITISKELKKMAGSADRFDPGLALEACDKIALKLDAQKKKPAPQKNSQADWMKAAKKHLPCASTTSIELMDNLASDESLASEPAFNTCVRMVKIMRKTGDCGSLVPTPTQKLANP